MAYCARHVADRRCSSIAGLLPIIVKAVDPAGITSGSVELRVLPYPALSRFGRRMNYSILAFPQPRIYPTAIAHINYTQPLEQGLRGPRTPILTCLSLACPERVAFNPKCLCSNLTDRNTYLKALLN